MSLIKIKCRSSLFSSGRLTADAADDDVDADDSGVGGDGNRLIVVLLYSLRMSLDGKKFCRFRGLLNSIGLKSSSSSAALVETNKKHKNKMYKFSIFNRLPEKEEFLIYIIFMNGLCTLTARCLLNEL